MGKEEPLVMEGVITEHLPNTRFRVKLDNDHMILAHLAGKLRRYHIRLLPGDRVKVELSPYDLSQGRIVYRLTGSRQHAQQQAAAAAAAAAGTAAPEPPKK